jgi:16S rRNA (guanine527-N7)-methyltransferase
MEKDGIELINKYFPELSERQREQFSALRGLYEEWNEKINVISRKDIENLYERHILHALAIAKIINFAPETKVMDVGTGGGFPGIPLAILFPEVHFTLVDSIGKKITVVQNVAEGAGLKNVAPMNIRAEKVKDKFDFVVARAVTDMREFYIWIKDKIAKEQKNSLRNGVIYLKGGDLREEMSRLNMPYEMFEINDYFTEEFFLTKKVVYVPQLTKRV